jgi:hypothetical protein
MAGITIPDQESVDLGNSRITPRETYAVDPRAIQNQYKDSVANADQLSRALAGLSKTAGQTEALQAEQELKQKDLIAASVMSDIKVGPDGSPVYDQLSTLREDLRPRLRAAVAESIGSTHGSTEARKAYEAEISKNPDTFNTPEGAQAFFQNWAAKEAARVGSNQFYGPSYLAAAKKYFAGADANEARARVSKMKKLIVERQGETLNETLFGKGVKGDGTGEEVAPPSGKLTSFIMKAEGTNGNFNAYYGNGKNSSVKLTDMTLSQLLKFQKGLAARTGSSAAGAFQIMQFNILPLAKTLGLDPATTKFTPQVQTRMMEALMERRGYSAWKTGKMDDKTFLGNLSKEWAGLPSSTGASFYAGDKMGNKAGVPLKDFISVLKAHKSGGEGVSTPSTGAMAGDFIDEKSPNPETGVQKTTLPTSQLFQNFQKWDSREALRAGDLISRKERKEKFIEVVTNRALATQDPTLLKQIPKFYVDSEGNKQAFLSDSEYITVQKSMKDIERIRTTSMASARKERDALRADGHMAAMTDLRTRMLRHYTAQSDVNKDPNAPADKKFLQFKITSADIARLQANAPVGFDAANHISKLMKSYSDSINLTPDAKVKITNDWMSKIRDAAFRGDVNRVRQYRDEINDGDVPSVLVKELTQEADKYLDPKYAGAISGPEFKTGLKTIEEIIDGQKGSALSLGPSVKANPYWPRVRAAYVQEFNRAMMDPKAKLDPSNTMHRFSAAQSAAQAIVPYVKSLFPRKAVELDKLLGGQTYDAFKAGKPTPSPQSNQATTATPAPDAKVEGARKKLFGR